MIFLNYSKNILVYVLLEAHCEKNILTLLTRRISSNKSVVRTPERYVSIWESISRTPTPGKALNKSKLGFTIAIIDSVYE